MLADNLFSPIAVAGCLLDSHDARVDAWETPVSAARVVLLVLFWYLAHLVHVGRA